MNIPFLLKPSGCMMFSIDIILYALYYTRHTFRKLEIVHCETKGICKLRVIEYFWSALSLKMFSEVEHLEPSILML
jgi:hypothetical protein